MPQSIIAVFLILYIIQPFVKRLRALEGLVWLPPLGLGITIGLFPAYGFRLECIPLLLFEIVLTMVNFPALRSSAVSRRNDGLYERKPVLTLLSLAALAAALPVMFVFSPKIPTGLLTAGVESRAIRNADRDYVLRIYRPVSPAGDVSVGGESAGADGQNSGIRPIVFLTPPEAGSIAAADRVCANLRDRGFTVISYSRRGFDFPATGETGRSLPVSPAAIRAMWRAFRLGTVLQKANEQGKALEAERLKDIEFLLPRIPALAERAAGPGSGKAPLILAGYGAGGSALVLLSASAGFTGRFGNVRGIVAIESRLWSAYRSDPPLVPQAPEGAPWHLRFRTAISGRLSGLKARRVSGFGPLPRPGVPLLCLVSGRALRSAGENPYRALWETARNAPRPAAVAAIAGAGPLDFTGYPLSHPLYSFLFPGRQKNAAKSANPPADTADIICNFAVMLLEREAALPEYPPFIMPARRGVSADVRIETWGMSNEQ
jgi:hypothetical protein